MGKVITVNIQKGGVGKTTTVHELASNLKAKGFKVLVIDLDQQLNLSKCSGAPLTGWYTIYDVLKGECAWEDALHKRKNYDIIPAHTKLEDAEKEFCVWTDVYKLTDALKTIKKKYDYVVIDTPPGFGILSDMALTAADYVIVPLEAEAFSIQGMGQLFERISRITDADRGSNKQLKIAGMLLTMYTDRTNLGKSIKEQLETLANRTNTKVFNTTIHKGVAIGEAQALNMSVLEHAPESRPCTDYINFTNELLKEIEDNG